MEELSTIMTHLAMITKVSKVDIISGRTDRQKRARYIL